MPEPHFYNLRMACLACSILSWIGTVLLILVFATVEMTGTDGSPGAGVLLAIGLALVSVVLWLVGAFGAAAGLRRTRGIASRERSLAKAALGLSCALAGVVIVLVVVAAFRPHWLGL
ncbi:MAG: hypothetical protein U0793_15570 [Gemmataceae bacterium]